MIIIDKDDKCCGCSACVNICPVNAINMEHNDEGFLYPVIDMEKCINCGLCEKVCPFKNVLACDFPKVIYGCHTKDIELLKKSSSGGIFGELSKYILKQNGLIVGVNSKYEYIIVDHESNLKDIYSSKYVQAKVNDIFKKVKDELEKNTLILFSGNPCTINGLKNFLKKDYANLYTCDFICHGVPSEQVLEKYKEIYNKDVKYIEFRNKEKGWHNYSTVIHFKNSLYRSLGTDNEYMNAFLKNYSLRESCYSCKAKGNNRLSDITLGDYWGINDHDEIYNFYGNSILVINSKKGIDLFNNIKKNLVYKEINEKELDKNPSYKYSSNRPKERDEFYKDLKRLSFKKITKKYNLGPKGLRKLKIKLKNIMKG